MDYSQLTDQEINIQVARIMHPDREVIESKSRPPSACVIGHLPSKWVDYCNNPADAWPIIDDSNIALIPSGGFGWVAVSNLTLNGKSSYIDEHLDDCFQCEDWSGLRAAMIVFLMMQENQNG